MKNLKISFKNLAKFAINLVILITPKNAINFTAFCVILFALNACESAENLSENCDLNKQNCTVLFEGQKIEFAFSTKPIVAMMPSALKITGLKGDFGDLRVKISGVNMNMGVINLPLQRRGDAYFATITMSACVSQMTYKIELFDGETPLNINIEFEM